jgi:hypothetical protein
MGLGQCIDKVVEGSDWKNKFSGWDPDNRKLPIGKGIGIACSSYICGAGLPIYWNNMPQSGVQLRLDRQGGVCVMCARRHWSGSDSILAYIVAEVLESIHSINVTADTKLTPVDLGSYSSRVTLMTGNAAIPAAESSRTTGDGGCRAGVPIEEYIACRAKSLTLKSDRSFIYRGRGQRNQFGTIGTVVYSPPSHQASTRGAASDHHLRTAIQRGSRVDVDPTLVLSGSSVVARHRPIRAGYVRWKAAAGGIGEI